MWRRRARHSARAALADELGRACAEFQHERESWEQKRLEDQAEAERRCATLEARMEEATRKAAEAHERQEQEDVEVVIAAIREQEQAAADRRCAGCAAVKDRTNAILRAAADAHKKQLESVALEYATKLAKAEEAYRQEKRHTDRLTREKITDAQKLEAQYRKWIEEQRAMGTELKEETKLLQDAHARKVALAAERKLHEEQLREAFAERKKLEAEQARSAEEAAEADRRQGDMVEELTRADAVAGTGQGSREEAQAVERSEDAPQGHQRLERIIKLPANEMKEALREAREEQLGPRRGQRGSKR